MSHTPGPWLAERHGAVTAVVDGVRRQVASTTPDPLFNDPDAANTSAALQMTNARLIAAAPEMLAELEAIIARLEDIHAPGSREFAADVEGVRLYERLCDALVKARGAQGGRR